MAGSSKKSNGMLANALEKEREAVRSVGKATTKFVADETSKSSKTFLEQLLGIDFGGKGHTSEPIHADGGADHQEAPQSYINERGVEQFDIFLRSANHTEQKASHTETRARAAMEYNRDMAAIDYHRETFISRERGMQREKSELSQSVEQIKQELQQLVKSSQELKMQFAEVGVESSPTEAGVYHTNFLEWMLSVIRSVRAKVEDAGAWLSVAKGKGAAAGYGNMAKKHGGMFTQSGERSVATSVG